VCLLFQYCAFVFWQVSCLEAVFGLLARCSAGNKPNQTRLRRCGGVSLLNTWLRFPTEENANKPQVVLAVVDCLWAAVVGNRSSENKLVAEVGGVLAQTHV
jgi:hypothetical protein